MTAAQPSPHKTQRKRKSTAGSQRIWPVFIFAFLIVALVTWSAVIHSQKAAPAAIKTAPDSPKIQLVYATHWSGKAQLDGLQKYLGQYTSLHPNISFSVQVIPADQYADKLSVLSAADAAPDIYQIHSDWSAKLVQKGVLGAVPADVQADVKNNYVSSDGATVDGQIRGVPTEIDNYAILYNKTLFKQAGIVDTQGAALAPQSWPELIADASKLTKKDSRGNFTQYGFATLKDQDWQMVDPFLSLLYSSGGHYLSANQTQSLFNSSYGVEALNALLSLPRSGSTSLSSNFFDFGQGNVGIVVSPPWTKNIFKTAFGDTFDSTVGVAPLPDFGAQKSSQYSWFTGVTAASHHQAEAWDFLRWFTEDTQTGTGTTRYGDLLTNVIGAIPDRKADLQNHSSLHDFFSETFVGQLGNSQPEPNIAAENTIKTALMTEIQAAWNGEKTAQKALDAAAAVADKALKPH